jgi:hypothetical protein
MAEAADSGGESSDSPASIEAKELPSRSTRGTRASSLLGEAKEADDDFWNQQAFNEDEGDTDFSEDSDAATTESSASDISDDEPTEEENIRKSARSSRAAQAQAYDNSLGDDGDGKRKGVYVDPALARGAKARVSGFAAAERRSRQNRLAVLLGADKARALLKSIAETESRSQQNAGASSSSSSSASAASGTDASQGVKERVAAIKALRIKAAEAAQKRPSQAEVLQDAAHTTLENLASLDAMLRSARANKAARRERAREDAGKRVCLRSSAKAGSVLVFIGADEVPPVLRSRPIAPPEAAVCAVTGKPAKYRDPRTGSYYADAAALKTLRQAETPSSPPSAESTAAAAASSAGNSARNTATAARRTAHRATWARGLASSEQALTEVRIGRSFGAASSVALQLGGHA